MTAGVWDRDDVSGWAVLSVEQAGSTQSDWLEEPVTARRWLHKNTVIPSSGAEQGEDWAEVVSTQVAELMGVPCAMTRLCTRDGRRGSLSLSIVPKGYSLWEGTVVMQRSPAPGFYSHTEGRPGIDPSRPEVKRPGHSLANIRSVLEGVAAPPDFDGPGSLNGFDSFVGCMVLDALISNRDRHEQNWAVLTPALVTSSERLAPSYDHGGSLGYNLLDAKRLACVQSPDRLQAWSEKGTAWRFEHVGRPITLVQHAVNALAICASPGADWWRERLRSLDLRPVLESLRNREISGMSDLAARFVRDLLELNLRRLRDAICYGA